MAFMKDILTHNIPIWEECAATPFVQEVQTGKLPLEKFKRYMIQDSIYLKNYARIYGKASNGVQGVQTRLKRKDRFESK